MVNPDISTKIDHLTLEEPFWMVYVNKPRRTYANDIHKVSSSFSLHVKENVPCQFGVMASLKGDPFRKKEGWWVPGERPVGRLKRLPPVINNYLGTSPISARDLPSKNAQRFENKFINYVPLFPGDFIKSPSIRLVCNVYLFSALHREVTRVHKGHVLEPTQHRSLDQHQTSERTTEKYTRIT